MCDVSNSALGPETLRVAAGRFTLFVSGAQGSGKSTLTRALLEHLDGEMFDAPQMREIVSAAFPRVRLGDLSPIETFSAFMLRALGRCRAPLRDQLYVSDGSLLNDLAYLRGRIEVGAFGDASRIGDPVFIQLTNLFEGQVTRFFTNIDNYLVLHLEPELALENDGYRPQNLPFRDYVDAFLRDCYRRFGLNFISVSGSIAERVLQVEKAIIEYRNLRNT